LESVNGYATGGNDDEINWEQASFKQAAQRLGLSTASGQKHRADRPNADHAMTFDLDHPMGAHQRLGFEQGFWNH
jgi:hypothetical protein